MATLLSTATHCQQGILYHDGRRGAQDRGSTREFRAVPQGHHLRHTGWPKTTLAQDPQWTLKYLKKM